MEPSQITPVSGVNILTETVVTFREAAQHCPRRRNGSTPHVTTFYRWRDQGLETLQVGGQLCTSVEALQRFFESLTKTRSKNPPISHTIQQRKHQCNIDHELSKLGV